MCGIAGLIGATNHSNAAATVCAMLKQLERRGPDGEGVEVWGNAVLGHRRLAIIDLSDAGRQPMLTPDQSVGVAFNGEIYNFQNLRSQLIHGGYEFRSRTDTEILLHGYDRWGLDGLVDRIQGMFAFALWDERRRKLFLVRDRLGVKPLLYTVRDGRLAFASTARALRVAGLAGEIDEQALIEFLEFGYVTDARSIYREVQKVPAATILEWSNGSIKLREYWGSSTDFSLCRFGSLGGGSLRQAAQIGGGAASFEEAVEETERLLLKAVERRLYADVPVGALLSGGVDSSLVCWATAKLGANVTTYTVGAPNDPWDETSDAVATARQLGLAHEVLPLSAADAPDANELVSAFGEPFACASALGMLSVSHAVSRSGKVLLTGDGGDDVFLGYEGHRHFLAAQKLARVLPERAADWWLDRRNRHAQLGSLQRFGTFLDYATGGLGAVARAHDGLPGYARCGMLGDRLRDLTLPQRQMTWSISSARRLLTEFLDYDRRMRLAGEYLPKVDGATMHHSIEARSPFLDQTLWEFASALPYEVRLRRGRLKAVLRELARRKIGDRVAWGRKRGFSIPVQRWLAGRWRGDVEESFSNSVLEKEGWLRSDVVLAELNAAARKGWASNQLWYSFVLETWLRHERSLKLETPDSVRDEIRVVA